jgi:hypothetical protein
MSAAPERKPRPAPPPTNARFADEPGTRTDLRTIRAFAGQRAALASGVVWKGATIDEVVAPLEKDVRFEEALPELRSAASGEK